MPMPKATWLLSQPNNALAAARSKPRQRSARYRPLPRLSTGLESPEQPTRRPIRLSQSPRGGERSV
jgi:hypothetical protein